MFSKLRNYKTNSVNSEDDLFTKSLTTRSFTGFISIGCHHYVDNLGNRIFFFLNWGDKSNLQNYKSR